MIRSQFQLTGILALVSILISSCWFMGPSIKGNGNVTEKTRQVDQFDQIRVSRGMNVYVTQGSPAKVLVIADSNLHDVIETKVEGGVLKITAREIIRSAKEKKVMVTVEKLSGVEATSGGNVWSQTPILSENLELDGTSGGNLTMEINARLLKVDCTSGANIRVSGLAKEAEMKVSSGGNIIGEALKADHCNMRASSGGNVTSTVVDQLDARASSGGNIAYYGEPKSSNIKSSSGGNIHRK